jgi:hypothetical protein
MPGPEALMRGRGRPDAGRGGGRRGRCPRTPGIFGAEKRGGACVFLAGDVPGERPGTGLGGRAPC